MTPDTARLFTLPALLLILSYLLIPCYTSFYSDFILPSHTILYWFYLTFSYHAILLSILILSYLLIPCYTSFYSDFILPSHTMLYFFLFWFYLTFSYHAIILSILRYSINSLFEYSLLIITADNQTGVKLETLYQVHNSEGVERVD